MSSHAPHHRPVSVDTGLLLLPLAGLLLGLVVGTAIGEATLGAILGASAGLLAGTTLRALRTLPGEVRRPALALIAVLALCGGLTLALVVRL